MLVICTLKPFIAVILTAELVTANSALAQYLCVRLGALIYRLLMLEKVVIGEITIPSRQKSFR